MEYERPATQRTSSGIAKAGLATAVGVGAMSLLHPNGLLGLGASNGAGVAPGFAPFARGAVEWAEHVVTDKEMHLIRENASKDAVIAQLRSENYATGAVGAAVAPLQNEICALKTQMAVNAARDDDFRRYVNAEFVHQPKARINESIVTCEQCGCGNDRC